MAAVVGEVVAELLGAAGEGAAAAEAAAAEVAAAEAVAVESEAGLEATIKAEEEAVEAAEKEAELEAGLGSRIGKALGGKIVAGLKGSLKLLKGLTSKAGDLLLLKTAIDKVPKEHRKELAGWAMLLAAGGNKLALVAYLYMRLSGGSEEGKKVAKEATEIVKGLHEHARNMKVDTPSKVTLNKQTHEAVMNKIKEKVDSDKQDMEEMNDILAEMDNLLKKHVDDHPHKGQEYK
ncbi:retrotransposon protein, putative, ty1-copia subclass [Tanacetum coccineum]